MYWYEYNSFFIYQKLSYFYLLPILQQKYFTYVALSYFIDQSLLRRETEEYSTATVPKFHVLSNSLFSNYDQTPQPWRAANVNCHRAEVSAWEQPHKSKVNSLRFLLPSSFAKIFQLDPPHLSLYI